MILSLFYPNKHNQRIIIPLITDPVMFTEARLEPMTIEFNTFSAEPPGQGFYEFNALSWS